ncbi:MAG: hypothetical protein WCK08_19560, partial [Betaproteobacteria bacterium]
VPQALQSLALARKEAEHLRYSQTTLFAAPLDRAWVQALGKQPALAEKVEAFASRFARLQDHLGEKLLPRFAALVGEPSRTLLDTLAFAERAQVLSDAQAFIAASRLRNALVHEYMHDLQVFLDSLLSARSACELFFSTIDHVDAQIARLGIARN